MMEDAPKPDTDTQPDMETKPAPSTGPVLFYAEGDTKADIRKKVWEYLESNKLASFPRPVVNRIPNYKGSAMACDKAAELEIFQKANTIKINPDKPQEQARFKTLEAKKTLLVPTPRLRTGLFNRIEPPDDTKPTLRFCSTSQGVRQHSTALGLEMKVKVDLVIIGSVAVSTEGWRIGKGEGYADLEYGMMAAIGAVDANTIVVSAVHDHQVMDLPDELFGPHDVSVDYICTPTRVIECSKRPKPAGIIWSILTAEKYARIPILKTLREQERAEGKDVTLFAGATEEELEQAIKDAAALEEERQKEREARQKEREEARERGEFPKRRFRRNRRRGPPRRDSEHEGEHEHADGEESPSGERRRSNRPPRRRNRRRNPDSERQGSEGEQHGEDGEVDGDNQRRRRPRRPRNRRNRPSGEPLSGTENDDQQHEDGQGQDRPQRRPRRYSNRNRNRRSEGEDGERNYTDDKPPPNRRRYRNNRGPPRNDERLEEGENSGDSQGEDRRRQRPRRNNNLPTVYVGSLPKAVRVSTFKKQVRDLDVNPLRVLWRGVNGHVFLIFQSMDETEDALKKLEHLSINDKEVKVALANRTERRKHEHDDEGNGNNNRGSGDNLKMEIKTEPTQENNEGTTTL